jgi:mycofactocin precursor peptide peptidase
VADLDRTTWPSVGERPLVLVPIGSTEQHGPHLPLGTDTAIAVGVAERVAQGLPKPAWVAPPIHHTSSGEHQGFPGTTSIGSEAFRLTVIELVRSLSLWSGRIVLVNAHGGNVPALVSAVSQLVEEQHDVAWVPCATEEVDAHAGHTETSLMLHLDPPSVLLSRAEPGNTAPIGDLLPELLVSGVLGVSPNGVLGDPTGASAREGARVLDEMVDDVRRRIDAATRDARGCLAPALVQPVRQ